MAETQYVDDVSQLDLQEIPDAVDYDQEYAAAQTFRPLPDPGAYFVRLPSKIKFGKTPKGGLQLVLDGAKIEDAQKPEADGFDLKFLSVSTSKIFDSNSSSANDLLNNFSTQGDYGKPKTAEEWAEFAKRIEGQLIPHPVYFTYGSKDKKQTDPKLKYVKMTSFRQNGQVVKEITRKWTNPETGNEEEYVVRAFLQPSSRGFAPPKETV